MKRVIPFFCCIILLLGMTACNKAPKNQFEAKPSGKGDAVETKADYTAYEGTYYEQIAQRGELVIVAEEDKAGIQVHWPNSAAEMYYWEMTAEADEEGVLHYDDAILTIVTFESETQSTSKVEYENGTGTFTLLEDGNMSWHDGMQEGDEDSIFVKADFE